MKLTGESRHEVARLPAENGFVTIVLAHLTILGDLFDLDI
jgi:hypothetical protein